jgi:hypothetical protein
MESSFQDHDNEIPDLIIDEHLPATSSGFHETFSSNSEIAEQKAELAKSNIMRHPYL